MHHVKLLDCTLRDGAYLVDKTFGDSTISGMIDGLAAAGIDIIEIGFLQDEGYGEGRTVFRDSRDAEKYIQRSSGRTCMYTVLADYSRYSIEKLDMYTGRSFDAVRACFFRHEWKDALRFCRMIKEKGYKLFVQPVDILGYSDRELLDLIEAVNNMEPYCFSIVDTFGSMYIDDMLRVYSIVHHNLAGGCRIGFHSHNNMQMSSALSQEFIHASYGQRQVIVDVTVSGMGRGAGNTPTELAAQYLVAKLGYGYDMDALLDIIDQYMSNIRTRCSWGYSTSYFIAGSYGAHVNNIAFLKEKNSISSKDIRYILSGIGADDRKRYDYELLEDAYAQYLKSDIDDTDDLQRLRSALKGRAVAILAPGPSAEDISAIKGYIKEKDAVAVCINYIPDGIRCSYLYLNNVHRYNVLRWDKRFSKISKILTSNITDAGQGDYVIRFSRLIKCGWEHMDNSAIMLLRLLDLTDVETVGIAGLDGYDEGKRNYISDDMERWNISCQEMNNEIMEMLRDFFMTKQHNIRVEFITKSRFQSVLEE